MSRYVDANLAPIYLNKAACEQIKRMPTEDVQEVRHGKWILEKEPDGKPYCFHCSVCDNDFHHIGIKTAFNFCPNCGAKMDLEEIK